MFKFRSLLAAAALATSAAIAATALVSSFAPAHAGSGNIADARIELAFASAAMLNADATLAKAAVRAQKGDMLSRPSCSDQVWPNIAPDCLVTAQGATPRPVRYVTVGHQSDATTTVLVRMPTLEVASR